MTARLPAAVRPLLWAFVALTAVHLAALAAGATLAAQLTKPALMPVLAGYVLARGGPVPLAGALLFGCGGDALLQMDGDTVFLVGMGSFAVGHVCYLLVFARHGTAPGRGRLGYPAGPAAVYGVLLAGTVALLWPDLPAGLRIPVAGYSLLLTAMAFGALRAGPLAALGGVLFLLSDGLLAGGLAQWPQPPLPQFWIMVTYIAAQFALAYGLLRTTIGPAPGPVSRPAPTAPEAGVP
ncbi:lysoplasmalogenase [Streptomyces sp. NPDC001339]|uniref:lysoplasmalogenase n=1 Tax=Streptomyces sp. NPDC001339 TaxID=3364563 RepID=UPI0036B0C592